MYFAGIDLAWAEKNYSGIAVIKGSRVEVAALKSLEDIVDFLEEKGEVFLGIDAPLIVKNTQGARDADRELNRDF